MLKFDISKDLHLLLKLLMLSNCCIVLRKLSPFHLIF